ncbi:MAG: hypothetical protein ACK51F_03295 [Rhodospirillales bacterium]
MDLFTATANDTTTASGRHVERFFADARRHVIYQIAHAPLRTYPFPHIVVEDALPDAFHAALQGMLPSDDAYAVTGIDQAGRPQRLAFAGKQARDGGLDPARRAFWTATFAALDHADTGAWLIAKFYDLLADRLGLSEAAAGRELRGSASLLRDRSADGTGPSTGPANTVLTAVFQLPRNANRRDLGMALYAPKDPELRCQAGRTLDRADFDRVTVLPYKPNTLIALPRTDASFVGFEPVEAQGACRDFLRFDLALPARLMH